MMKYNLISYIIIWCTFITFIYTPIYSQIGFNKIVDFYDSRSNNFDDIIYKNDKIYISGNALIDSINLWGITFSVFDTLGSKLFEKIYFDSTRISHIISNTPTKFLISQDNRIIIPYYLYNLNKLGVILLDTLGNLFRMKEFPNAERSIYPGDVFEYKGDIYLIGRIQRTNYRGDIYVIKTDLN